MPTTMISLRMDDETLAAIDKAAQQHHETRTTYILSWVPEYQANQPQPSTPRHNTRYTRSASHTAANHQR